MMNRRQFGKLALTAGAILRVVNPKALNPMSIMPAFHKTEGLHRVMKEFQGKPILSAEQIEHVVAYLMTLK